MSTFKALIHLSKFDARQRRGLYNSLEDSLLGSIQVDSVLPGYLLKAGQLEYDCRYSKMHDMPVTGGRGFRSVKLLWYKGVPP